MWSNALKVGIGTGEQVNLSQKLTSVGRPGQSLSHSRLRGAGLAGPTGRSLRRIEGGAGRLLAPAPQVGRSTP